MSNLIKVVGFDPSLRNWGIASGTLDLNVGIESLKIIHIDVIQPNLPTGKTIRQNSLDLESAAQLARKAYIYAEDADAVFAEVPVGSQSSRAMASYGICIGVLGALRTSKIPFYEVTPMEVKLSSVGIKTASKKQMIEWATTTHPEANWPVYKKNGLTLISEANAEHMADAIASIYAGIQGQQFQQVVRLKRGK